MRGCLLRTKEVVGLNQTPKVQVLYRLRFGTHTDVENTPLSGICISDVICVKNKKKQKNVIVIDRKQE